MQAEVGLLAFAGVIGVLLVGWCLAEPKPRRMLGVVLIAGRNYLGLLALVGILVWYWPKAREASAYRSFSGLTNIAIEEYAAERQYDGDRLLSEGIVTAAAILAMAMLLRPAASQQPTAPPPPAAPER